MPATKSAPAKKAAPVARNAKASKPAAKPSKPAKQEAKRTAVVEIQKSRNAVGREIQECMSKSLLTIAQLAERVGCTEQRAQAHYDYEASKSRAKLDSRKRVVVLSQPIRRNAT